MTTLSSTATPAPTLRRGLAWIVDSLILGVPLVGLGWMFFEPAADLGDAGRWIGVAAVALYFGAFESGWGEGMSLGKAWLGLQVVDRPGAFLSPARAAARALFAYAPLLLGGLSLPSRYWVAGWIVWLLVNGLRLAQPYLAVFNRPSRRCLHDFAFETMVIKRDSGVPAAARLSPVHVAVVAALFAFALIASRGLLLVIPTPTGTVDAVGAELARRVAVLPDVRSAYTNFQSHWSSQTGRSEGLHIKAELRRWPADPAAVADAAAQVIFHGDAPLSVNSPMTLTLHRGFTFGIAQFDYEESYRLGARGPVMEAEE